MACRVNGSLIDFEQVINNYNVAIQGFVVGKLTIIHKIIKWINNSVSRVSLILVTFILTIMILTAQYYKNFGGTWLKMEYWDEHSTAIRNMALIGFGLIGLVFGIVRTLIAAKATEISDDVARTAARSHVTSSFTDAIEHLGSQKLSIRLGGIYALKKIAKDQPDEYKEVIGSTLQAFIRSTSISDGEVVKVTREADVESGIVERRMKEDISAALDTIVVLKVKNLNLSNTYLPRALIPDSELRLVNFRGSDLAGSDLAGADLSKADLISTILRDVDLTNACLIDTHLFEADLSMADLTGANFKGANLGYADFGKTIGLTIKQLQEAKDITGIQLDKELQKELDALKE